MDTASRFYEPLSSFIEQDSEPLRKRILHLVYASIYADQSPDVTRCLLRAYEAQCGEDEQPEPETFEHDKAYEFMANLYVARRVHQGRDPVSSAEEFEWPEALPRDIPLRKGILRCVAIRMASADNWMYKKMREAYLAEHPETPSPTV
jgi:hypothetical protein